MLSGLFTALTRETRFVVRRGALGIAAAVFLVLGLLSLTAAAWLLIAQHYGAVSAWLALALFYVGIGLGILLWSRRAKRLHKLEVMARTSPFSHTVTNSRSSVTAGVVEAFLLGLTAGMKK